MSSFRDERRRSAVDNADEPEDRPWVPERDAHLCCHRHSAVAPLRSCALVQLSREWEASRCQGQGASLSEVHPLPRWEPASPCLPSPLSHCSTLHSCACLPVKLVQIIFFLFLRRCSSRHRNVIIILMKEEKTWFYCELCVPISV